MLQPIDSHRNRESRRRHARIGCQLIVATDVLAGAGIAARAEDVMIRGLSVPRAVALVKRARDLPDIPEPPAPAEPGLARTQ